MLAGPNESLATRRQLVRVPIVSLGLLCDTIVTPTKPLAAPTHTQVDFHESLITPSDSPVMRSDSLPAPSDSLPALSDSPAAPSDSLPALSDSPPTPSGSLGTPSDPPFRLSDPFTRTRKWPSRPSESLAAPTDAPASSRDSKPPPSRERASVGALRCLRVDRLRGTADDPPCCRHVVVHVENADLGIVPRSPLRVGLLLVEEPVVSAT